MHANCCSMIPEHCCNFCGDACSRHLQQARVVAVVDLEHLGLRHPCLLVVGHPCAGEAPREAARDRQDVDLVVSRGLPLQAEACPSNWRALMCRHVLDYLGRCHGIR